jgi:DNA-binding MarR family transcriptional regulator
MNAHALHSEMPTGTTGTENVSNDVVEYLPQLMTRVLYTLNSGGMRDLAELGLSASACRTLIALLRHRQLRVSRLAMLVGLEATGLSHLMRTLEERKLISRERGGDDHRSVLVTLTDQGRAQARICDELFQRTESNFLRNFTVEDVNQIRDLLERMIKIADGLSPERGLA